MMICDKCRIDFEEKDIQEHHLHPRFMDNKKGVGSRIQLCTKCHNILHLIIPKIIWQFVIDKDKCLEKVIEYSKKYGGEK